MSRAVEKIKEKLNIVDVVSSYVTLKKAGIHHKGLCPFHNERTPSFTVSAERNSYYCFGCGAKGDIFSFIQEYEGVDFKEALKILADRSGVDLSDEKYTQEKKIDKSLYDVLSLAMDYYISLFNVSSDIEKYLLDRGMKKETIIAWNIGYARDEWRGLYDFLSAKGISKEKMLSAGLVKKKEGSDQVYDVFRGRITFPIRDAMGRIVAFTGRITVKDDNLPKYLNTPETEIFNKSEILYGLDKAKQAIRKLDYVVIVEGQMDVIMSHQAGVKNVVASSGTAFTTSHLAKLSPITKRIIFAFDSDKAGISALKRSALLALKAGFDVKALVLVGSKDPADMVKENPDLWINSLKGSKPVIDYLLSELIDEKIDTRNKVKKISSDIMPFVASLTSPIEKAHYIKKISELFSLSESAVWSELENGAKLESVTKDEIKEEIKQDGRLSGKEERERMIVGALLLSERNGGIPYLEKNHIRTEIERIKGQEGLRILLEKFDGKEEELLFQSEEYLLKEQGKPNELVSSLLSSYEIEHINVELQKIKQEMRFSEQKGDSGKTLELSEKYDKLNKRKHSLLAT